MFHTLIFQDEITLWWDREEFGKNANGYKLYLDGVFCGETDKTHYTFSELEGKRAYQVCVEWYQGAQVAGKKEFVFTTKETKNRIDITKAPYCAVGDGKTLNTVALQKALDDCTENDVVYFPAGTYLSGALNVHSDTEIYLAEGALLKGSERVEDYLPKIKSRFEGTEMMCYRSLLNLGELDHSAGYNCKNVAIRGKGTIFGGGRPLALAVIEVEKELLKEYMAENAEYVKSCENANTIPGRARGRLINMSNCENVILSGLTMGYGPSWNIHFIYSKNIVTYNCFIRSNVLSDEAGNMLMDGVWNGDGWDPDSSEDCVIFGTAFATGDDCIAIKSGKNPEGNIINRPTKNVYIFDCVTKAGHSVAIGSEMSGGVENVRIWDCNLKNCAFGVQVKAAKARGGYIKNLSVCNCEMKTVYVRSGVVYNNDGESAPTPPIFSDYYYENITLYGREEKDGREYVSISGFDEAGYELKNVCFKGIRFVGTNGESGIIQENVANVQWQDVEYLD